MSSVISCESRYSQKTSFTTKSEANSQVSKYSRIRSAYSQKHKDKVEQERVEVLNEIIEKHKEESEKHKKLMKENLTRLKNQEKKLKENEEKSKAEAEEKLKERKKNIENAYNKYFKGNAFNNNANRSSVNSRAKSRAMDDSNTNGTRNKASTPRNKLDDDDLVIIKNVNLNAEINNPSKLLESLDLSGTLTGFKGLRQMSDLRKNTRDEDGGSSKIPKTSEEDKDKDNMFDNQPITSSNKQFSSRYDDLDSGDNAVKSINNNLKEKYLVSQLDKEGHKNVSNIKKDSLKSNPSNSMKINTNEDKINKQESKENNKSSLQNKSKNDKLNDLDDIKHLLGIEETSVNNDGNLFGWANLGDIDPAFLDGLNQQTTKKPNDKQNRIEQDDKKNQFSQSKKQIDSTKANDRIVSSKNPSSSNNLNNIASSKGNQNIKDTGKAYNSPAIEIWEEKNKNQQEINTLAPIKTTNPSTPTVNSNFPASNSSISANNNQNGTNNFLSVNQYRPPSEVSEMNVSKSKKPEAIIITNINSQPNSKNFQKKKSIEITDSKPNLKPESRSSNVTNNLPDTSNKNINYGKPPVKKPPLMANKKNIPQSQKLSRKDKKGSLSPPTTICTRDENFDVEEFIKDEFTALNQEEVELQQDLMRLQKSNAPKIKNVEKKYNVNLSYKSSKELENKFTPQSNFDNRYQGPINESAIEDSLERLDVILIKHEQKMKQQKIEQVNQLDNQINSTNKEVIRSAPNDLNYLENRRHEFEMYGISANVYNPSSQSFNKIEMRQNDQAPIDKPLSSGDQPYNKNPRQIAKAIPLQQPNSGTNQNSYKQWIAQHLSNESNVNEPNRENLSRGKDFTFNKRDMQQANLVANSFKSLNISDDGNIDENIEEDIENILNDNQMSPKRHEDPEPDTKNPPNAIVDKNSSNSFNTSNQVSKPSNKELNHSNSIKNDGNSKTANSGYAKLHSKKEKINEGKKPLKNPNDNFDEDSGPESLKNLDKSGKIKVNPKIDVKAMLFGDTP